VTASDPNDPLVCINARMAGEPPQCGEPDSDHCEGCLSCPGLGNCVCRNASPLDQQWLAAALDAFAQHGGATSWQALADVSSHTTAEHYRADVAAAITPLQDEIRRLTIGSDPAMLPAARELVDGWNRRTDEEQLALAEKWLGHQQTAVRCAMGQCTTKTDHVAEAENEDPS